MSSSTDSPASSGAPTEERHQAGAFDIRNFIALLIGIYGVVLTVYGIVDHGADQTRKTDGININLWAGLGMVVVAVGFILWARLRPVVVPDAAVTSADHADHADHAGYEKS